MYFQPNTLKYLRRNHNINAYSNLILVISAHNSHLAFKLHEKYTLTTTFHSPSPFTLFFPFYFDKVRINIWLCN